MSLAQESHSQARLSGFLNKSDSTIHFIFSHQTENMYLCILYIYKTHITHIHIIHYYKCERHILIIIYNKYW